MLVIIVGCHCFYNCGYCICAMKLGQHTIIYVFSIYDNFFFISLFVFFIGMEYMWIQFYDWGYYYCFTLFRFIVPICIFCGRGLWPN